MLIYMCYHAAERRVTEGHWSFTENTVSAKRNIYYITFIVIVLIFIMQRGGAATMGDAIDKVGGFGGFTYCNNGIIHEEILKSEGCRYYILLYACIMCDIFRSVLGMRALRANSHDKNMIARIFDDLLTDFYWIIYMVCKFFSHKRTSFEGGYI